MKIIDTHAHLDHLENLDQSLENARQAGVEGIVAISMDLKSCQKNLELKQTIKSPKIYLAMGMHPSEANLNDLLPCLELARQSVKHLHAIGEIGLDFWYKEVKKSQEKKDEQRKVFHSFLALSRDLNLPAIIHSRGAWQECLDITQEAGVKKAVFHWYSGPVDVLEKIMAQGYFVSASPSLATSPQSREAISVANIKQILIETDSPVYYRINETEGFKSEPRDVFRTLKTFCQLKSIEEEKGLEILNENAKQFFNLN